MASCQYCAKSFDINQLHKMNVETRFHYRLYAPEQ